MRFGTRFIVIVVALGGCGSSSPPGVDGAAKGADAKQGTDAKQGADIGSSDSSSAACPQYLPEDASSCLTEGLVCTYGPDADCLAQAICSGSSWQVTLSRCSGSAASCPDTYALAAGEGCDTADETCSYAGLSCSCTNCVDYPVSHCEGPLTWHCQAPNADPACPYFRPDVGASCSKEGTFCDYGCESDASRSCEGGSWVAASSPGGCPISTRQAKKQIRYLSETDLAHIAAQASSLKLATYRYRGQLDDRRSHLGFILEDSPTCAAANMDKLQVDLYSYTSMVLALAQRQQQELAELKQELGALRTELARIKAPGRAPRAGASSPPREGRGRP